MNAAGLSGAPGEREVRRFDRLGFWLAMVAIPLVWPLIGNWLIWNVLGNEGYIPYPSVGGEVLDFWHSGGLGLTVGLLTFSVLHARRWPPGRVLGFTALGVAIAYVAIVIETLVWLMLNPNALN